MNCQQDGEVIFRDLQLVDVDGRLLESFRLTEGDILFNRTNSFELVGRTAIFRGAVPAVFASYLVRLRADHNSLNPEFLNYFMNLPSTQLALKAYATRGVSQSNISASKLKQLPVPVPPLSEQAEIVAILDSLRGSLASASIKGELQSALFTAVLHLLMTGQVRVPPGLIDGQVPGRLERKPTPKAIDEIVRRIVEVAASERIFLFGSRVPGSPSAQGGVGLLVVMPFEGTSLGQAIRIERAVKPEFLLELLVRRPDVIDRALEYGDSFIRGIVERGRLVYASPAPPRRPEPRKPVERRAVSDELLQDVVRRIVEVAAPEKIILFGSAARGEMGPDSDLDFLVVKGGAHRRETANLIRRHLLDVAPGIPKDVIVVHPEDIERHRDTIGYIIRPALREGRVLYAA